MWVEGDKEKWGKKVNWISKLVASLDAVKTLQRKNVYDSLLQRTDKTIPKRIRQSAKTRQKKLLLSPRKLNLNFRNIRFIYTDSLVTDETLFASQSEAIHTVISTQSAQKL